MKRPPGRYGNLSRLGRYGILKVAVACLVSLYLLLQCQSIPAVRRLLKDEELVHGSNSFGDPTYHPKISLIVVWAGTKRPNYLTWFLDSIARQPEEVELVVIQRGDALMDFTALPALRASNIRIVQMSDDRYWDMHREYFCKRWGGCSEGDRRRIDHHLREMGENDPQSYSLSILRGEVFKPFIHPGVDWWGWCDLDTVMGSFKRKCESQPRWFREIATGAHDQPALQGFPVPWDIAGNYDVILPVHRSGDKERAVFMRGHLAFFRNSRAATEKIAAHPHFQTKDGWLNMRHYHYIEACRKTKTLGCSPKEAWYSSYIVNHPDINFLSFDALANKHYIALTGNGAYTISSINDARHLAVIAERFEADSVVGGGSLLQPTFSESAIVRPVELIQGNFSGPLWFHPRHATHYAPLYGNGDESFRNDHYITYLHRLDGVVEERLELVSRTNKRPELVEEWLYVHWQEEKKKDWFKAIPGLSIGTDDRILVTEGHGAGGFRKIALVDNVYSMPKITP